jgi:hypothetical protein
MTFWMLNADSGILLYPDFSLFFFKVRLSLCPKVVRAGSQKVLMINDDPHKPAPTACKKCGFNGLIILPLRQSDNKSYIAVKLTTGV